MAQATPHTPANWIAYRATVRFGDGSIRATHEFFAPADLTESELRSHVYSIWTPARAGRDGSFVDPTLTVEAVAAGLQVAA